MKDVCYTNIEMAMSLLRTSRNTLLSTVYINNKYSVNKWRSGIQAAMGSNSRIQVFKHKYAVQLRCDNLSDEDSRNIRMILDADARYVIMLT